MPPYLSPPLLMVVLTGEEDVEEIAIGVDNLLLEVDDGSQLLLDSGDLLILEG